MLSAEFPHPIVVQQQVRVPDGGGGYEKESIWTEVASLMAFMDTPSSTERFEAMKANYPLDRYLYYPYRTDFKPAMRVLFEGATYNMVSEPEDQGGQHEIMRVALELVRNG